VPGFRAGLFFGGARTAKPQAINPRQSTPLKALRSGDARQAH
jgi:hypothetical protein